MQNRKVQKPTVRREKKKYEPRDYHDELNSKAKVVAPEKTRLQTETLKKWQNNELTLPDDFGYNLKGLLKPFLKPHDLYTCQRPRTRRHRHGGDINDYHGDGMSDDDSIHDARDDGFDNDGGDDFGHAFPSSQNPHMVFPSSQVTEFATQTANITCSQGFTGENMIPEVFTIDQIHLPFAKHAKKIDVKALKTIMSASIKAGEETAADHGDGGDGGVVDDEQDKKQKPFSEIYHELPEHQRASQTLISNMTAPIAFTVLLHLANEENLQIEHTPDQDYTELRVRHVTRHIEKE